MHHKRQKRQADQQACLRSYHDCTLPCKGAARQLTCLLSLSTAFYTPPIHQPITMLCQKSAAFAKAGAARPMGAARPVAAVSRPAVR